MPIYAYKCSACGFAKDILQKISDPILTECPNCQASTFSKQLTAAGFQLKGSGWYATDFKDGGASTSPATAEASDTTTKPAAAGSSEATPTKTDSAPATATSGACGSGCACHS